MTNPDRTPQTESPSESEEPAGADLVVQGLVRALTGSTEVIIIEETDGGFELTVEGERGPNAA